MMKQYIKLEIPKDTAWNASRRPKWLRHVNWRIKEFFTSIYMIVRWIPITWKDRDWDDYYITKLLQKKIEFQRAYLVSANRHVNVDRDNFWMTVALNLLERKHEDYYSLEKHEYMIMDKTTFNVCKSETLYDYIKKYPSAERAVRKKYLTYPHLNDKDAMSLFMGTERQRKCNDLIFEILKRHSAEWWD